jgi:hypothetical protein
MAAHILSKDRGRAAATKSKDQRHPPSNAQGAATHKGHDTEHTGPPCFNMMSIRFEMKSGDDI